MDIHGFFGEYRWLSNFYELENGVNDSMGILYKTVEAAYQASKTLRESERIKISFMAAKEAKRYGRKLILREDWNKTSPYGTGDVVKEDVMYNLVLQKFRNNTELGTKLINTGNCHIEETNTWRDTYWGVCNGVGQNKLGEIIIAIRYILQGVGIANYNE